MAGHRAGAACVCLTRASRRRPGHHLGRFRPKPSEGVCRWCDFKPICPIFKDQYAGMPRFEPRASRLARSSTRHSGAWPGRGRQGRANRRLKLSQALKKKGYVRAFGERFEATLSSAVRWEFMDKKKVLEIIKKAGVYEKVLAPSAPLVNKLMADPALDGDLKARLTELGERVESPELKLKAL